MTYKQYLRIKEFYDKDRIAFEKNYNNQLYKTFISPSRFIDAFLEKDLSEKEFDELMNNYIDQAGFGFMYEITELEPSQEETDEISLFRFYLGCLKFRKLVLTKTLDSNTIDEYLNQISILYSSFLQIPKDYGWPPINVYWTDSKKVESDLPDLFEYNDCPYEDLSSFDFYSTSYEDDYHSLSTKIEIIYEFTSIGDEYMEKKLYHNAYWMYLESFNYSSVHILAAINALNQLKNNYDNYLIFKKEISYDTFTFLFPTRDKQTEALRISTNNQIYNLLITASDEKDIYFLAEFYKDCDDMYLIKRTG